MSNDRVKTIDLFGPQQAVIDAAVEALHNGGLIVAPTETMYGLLCRADNQEALDRLYQAKQRPDHMPTAVFVNSIEQMERCIAPKMPAETVCKYPSNSLTVPPNQLSCNMRLEEMHQ